MKQEIIALINYYFTTQTMLCAWCHSICGWCAFLTASTISEPGASLKRYFTLITSSTSASIAPRQSSPFSGCKPDHAGEETVAKKSGEMGFASCTLFNTAVVRLLSVEEDPMRRSQSMAKQMHKLSR